MDIIRKIGHLIKLASHRFWTGVRTASIGCVTHKGPVISIAVLSSSSGLEPTYAKECAPTIDFSKIKLNRNWHTLSHVHLLEKIRSNRLSLASDEIGFSRLSSSLT